MITYKSKLNATTHKMGVQGMGGVVFYLDYTKGDEGGFTITFKLKDTYENGPTDQYDLCTPASPPVPVSIRIETTGKYCIPFSLPSCINEVEPVVTMDAVGEGETEGTLDVYANVTNIYA